MPDADPMASPIAAPIVTPIVTDASRASTPSAWGLWSSVGWVVLLAAAALALATAQGALGEALDVGRWFR